ncbi:MAG: hypothetical protein JSW47_07125 [Phycisphaerales bacterium]|nr:MAG: hypothetical protein JSW47_07125 [Phycisphaerales bacterium]UCF16145.1 MAG: hypothetical protein JSW59_01535 [Phycisphaerales bacterium]
MKPENIKQLLNELGPRTAEPIRPGLNEEIKQRIPHKLTRHKIGWDTVNIIIDLRLNRSVAAAVIIISFLVLLNLYGSRDATGGGIVQDSKLLIKYLGTGGKTDIEAGKDKYELLRSRGDDVAWYGDWIDPADSNAVLMQQNLPTGRYMVTFVDGREAEVDSKQLVELLSRTMQKKSK